MKRSIKILLTLCMLLVGLAIFQYATFCDDKCEEWKWKDTPIQIQTCTSGNERGYIRVHNASDKNVSFCWEIQYSDGKRTKGCKRKMRAYSTSMLKEDYILRSSINKLFINDFEAIESH